MELEQNKLFEVLLVLRCKFRTQNIFRRSIFFVFYKEKSVEKLRKYHDKIQKKLGKKISRKIQEKLGKMKKKNQKEKNKKKSVKSRGKVRKNQRKEMQKNLGKFGKKSVKIKNN